GYRTSTDRHFARRRHFRLRQRPTCPSALRHDTPLTPWCRRHLPTDGRRRARWTDSIAQPGRLGAVRKTTARTDRHVELFLQRKRFRIGRWLHYRGEPAPPRTRIHSPQRTRKFRWLTRATARRTRETGIYTPRIPRPRLPKRHGYVLS